MDMQHLQDHFNALPGFNRHNGITVVEVGEGRAVAQFPLTDETLNPQGTGHGGLLFSLADVAAGVACFTRGRMCVTQCATANYLRPATGTCITATATEIHCGRHTGVYAVALTDDRQRLVAQFQFTMFRVEKAVTL